MYGLTTITQPTWEPITVDEAKIHARIDYDVEDALIGTWITAARELAESHTGKRFPEQSLRLELGEWPCEETDRQYAIRLPVEPVTAIEKIEYYNAAGTLIELDEAEYQTWLNHHPPLVMPKPLGIWPVLQSGRAQSLAVEFTAGYATAELVPAQAKQAIYLTLTYWNEHRGDSKDPTEHGLPLGAKRLLDSLATGSYC